MCPLPVASTYRRRWRSRRLAVLCGVIAIASLMPTPASAAASKVLVDWQMNEPPGSRTMVDASVNKINGVIGSAVQTGVVVSGATGYRWSDTKPDGYPPKPERLVQVNDARLNPGSRDYAVTVRFRTTHSYGNILQKGQSTTPGGYFKWEIPNGILMCLFRSRDQNGNLVGQKSVRSPSSTPLNDGRWHTVRCEKTADRVTMTIDGAVTVRSPIGYIGPISNTYPLTIGGKINCDQVNVGCDYFAGAIDFIRIETS